jgi:hypothetical protein
MTYDRKMKLINKLGRYSPFVMSNLYGEFFRSSNYAVFTDADINAAISCMSLDKPRIGRAKRAYCDFSGGGDELTFGMREGNYIHPIVAWTRDDHVAPSVEGLKYCKLFKEKELHSGEIYGDNGGLGAGIISEIQKHGYNMTRVNANVSPQDKDQFVDKATEDHWKFKQLLHDGFLILPKDDILLNQMRRRRYIMKNTEDNKFRLESKKEAKLKRKENSPDRLETVVGLCADMESLPTIQEMERGAVRTGVPAEYFKKIRENADDGESSSFGEEWQ